MYKEIVSDEISLDENMFTYVQHIYFLGIKACMFSYIASNYMLQYKYTIIYIQKTFKWPIHAHSLVYWNNVQYLKVVY